MGTPIFSTQTDFLKKGPFLWSPYIVNRSEFCFYVFGKVVAIDKKKKFSEQAEPKKLRPILQNLKNVEKMEHFF